MKARPLAKWLGLLFKGLFADSTASKLPMKFKIWTSFVIGWIKVGVSFSFPFIGSNFMGSLHAVLTFFALCSSWCKENLWTTLKMMKNRFTPGTLTHTNAHAVRLSWCILVNTLKTCSSIMTEHAEDALSSYNHTDYTKVARVNACRRLVFRFFRTPGSY